ncbi:hypothetical protein BC941DRAFT_510128 [Chlamydoabsidia padenii]|nr:hypothetical protein BC941DRAFT_510128 [Chlamydoabsidia padenii]
MTVVKEYQALIDNESTSFQETNVNDSSDETLTNTKPIKDSIVEKGPDQFSSELPIRTISLRLSDIIIKPPSPQVDSQHTIYCKIQDLVVAAPCELTLESIEDGATTYRFAPTPRNNNSVQQENRPPPQKQQQRNHQKIAYSRQELESLRNCQPSLFDIDLGVLAYGCSKTASDLLLSCDNNKRSAKSRRSSTTSRHFGNQNSTNLWHTGNNGEKRLHDNTSVDSIFSNDNVLSPSSSLSLDSTPSKAVSLSSDLPESTCPPLDFSMATSLQKDFTLTTSPPATSPLLTLPPSPQPSRLYTLSPPVPSLPTKATSRHHQMNNPSSPTSSTSRSLQPLDLPSATTKEALCCHPSYIRYSKTSFDRPPPRTTIVMRRPM